MFIMISSHDLLFCQRSLELCLPRYAPARCKFHVNVYFMHHQQTINNIQLWLQDISVSYLHNIIYKGAINGLLYTHRVQRLTMGVLDTGLALRMLNQRRYIRYGQLISSARAMKYNLDLWKGSSLNLNLWPQNTPSTYKWDRLMAAYLQYMYNGIYTPQLCHTHIKGYTPHNSCILMYMYNRIYTPQQLHTYVHV